jgi:menaquinol-cytochrome c reductase iron-sulfur subunit
MMRSFAATLAGFVSAIFAFWTLRWLLRRDRGESEPARPTADEGADGGEEDAVSPERRRLLGVIGVAGAGLTATAIGAPVVGFVLAPMFRVEPGVWRDVGGVDDFLPGGTVLVAIEDPSPLPWAGVTAASGAWLRRLNESDFEAFSVVCTHLGCAVRWLEEPNFFMCPCHGAVFDREGQVAAGPARRPLVRHDVRVREGRVEVQTLALPVTGPIGAAD